MRLVFTGKELGTYIVRMDAYLLRGEIPPRCLSCQVESTVEHVLLHFVSLTSARDKFSVLM